MISRQAYFDEKDDIYDIESFSFKDSEVILVKDNKRLCVPGPKISLFRSTDILDSQNAVIYEMDILRIYLTFNTHHLLGYTTVRYKPEMAGFFLDDFIAVFPDTGEAYLSREEYPKVFNFGSLANLISSPVTVLRIGNFYEVEKATALESERAMYCINKLKKDLTNPPQ